MVIRLVPAALQPNIELDSPLPPSSLFYSPYPMRAPLVLPFPSLPPRPYDRLGLTPLHAAASGGHVEVASALLAAHANPRRRAADGATPHHLAERRGHVAMVKRLAAAEQQARLERGAWLASSQCPRTRMDRAAKSFLKQRGRGQGRATRLFS